jgi:hypothetical protein
MLTFKLISSDVLEVKEQIHNFRDTKTSYWYTNFKEWKQSSFGKQNDKCDRDMTPESIAWCKKYYLPKVL